MKVSLFSISLSGGLFRAQLGTLITPNWSCRLQRTVYIGGKYKNPLLPCENACHGFFMSLPPPLYAKNLIQEFAHCYCPFLLALPRERKALDSRARLALKISLHYILGLPAFHTTRSNVCCVNTRYLIRN